MLQASKEGAMQDSDIYMDLQPDNEIMKQSSIPQGTSRSLSTSSLVAHVFRQTFEFQRQFIQWGPLFRLPPSQVCTFSRMYFAKVNQAAAQRCFARLRTSGLQHPILRNQSLRPHPRRLRVLPQVPVKFLALRALQYEEKTLIQKKEAI